jgi:hypothetical protein
MRAVARLAPGGPKGELVPAVPSASTAVRRRAAGRVATVGVAVAALFLLYWRQSRLAPVTSDGASNALQAWAMLHGNLLLHGWQLSDVSFYATELPQYMLIEAVGGLGPWVVHLAAAMTYTLIVVLSAFLARGRARGPEGLTRALLADGVILAPQLGATSTLLTAPDHTGTAVPLLLAWLAIDQNPRGTGWRRHWLVPAVVCILLTLATVSDELALIVGIVPLVVACGLRLARKIAAPRWYETWLVWDVNLLRRFGRALRVHAGIRCTSRSRRPMIVSRSMPRRGPDRPGRGRRADQRGGLRAGMATEAGGGSRAAPRVSRRVRIPGPEPRGPRVAPVVSHLVHVAGRVTGSGLERPPGAAIP